MTGIVVELHKNGIGWIKPDDGSAPYFFHKVLSKGDSEPVFEGDQLHFDRKSGFKENFAVNVRKVK